MAELVQTPPHGPAASSQGWKTQHPISLQKHLWTTFAKAKLPQT